MTGERIWAVVPVKPFSLAKRRLASVLGEDERARLARAMFEDVLDALMRVRPLAGIIVVTRDAVAAALARSRGAVILADDVQGINAALGIAVGHLSHEPHATMIVVPSDLPQLTPEHIDDIVGRLPPERAVALVPSNDGGTNLLALRPADAIARCFGPSSFAAHCAAARQAGIAPLVIPSAELGCDIDRPEDLAAFLAFGTCTRTHAFLSQHSLLCPLPLRERAAQDVQQTRMGEGYSFNNTPHPSFFAGTLSSPLPAEVGCFRLRQDSKGPNSGKPEFGWERAREAMFSHADALALADCDDLDHLMQAAARRRDRADGHIVSYSRKVFIPLTKLCRDVCHYCAFAQPPRADEAAYLSRDEVLSIARAGKDAGCKEALFTLGDKPELRYRTARVALDRLGHATTLAYLAEAARAVFDETGLLPHVNPGLLDAGDIATLRKVSVSQGIMLESAAERLCARGGPHFGSPDKHPAARLDTIRLAGEQRVPFTSGILIGIGETRRERIEALLALRDLHDAHGHIQEIIIQNFRPKPGTKMADAAAPSLDELLWTIAVARLIFAPEMNIQAPPNLSPGALRRLVEAGINDWGGVSPVTPDHVNPEAPWPHLQILERATAAAGKRLTERLAIYPAYAREPARWVDPGLRTALLHTIDADGFPRTDDWSPGQGAALPPDAGLVLSRPAIASNELAPIIARAEAGYRLDERDIVRMFQARGNEFSVMCSVADDMRKAMSGDVISYVVTRNINYTNICYFKCQFCAFSKGKMSENLRGRPYNLGLQEIAERAREAWKRGATEVCMQGGIHPDYTGDTYLQICRAVKEAVPEMHVHAFSPLEVHQGAATLGISLDAFFAALKDAGLGTLPGTAAEILDDEVRNVICPDKINTQRWLEVMRAAHHAGFKSTATIMYGHIEGYQHWARHLIHIRALQADTGGFTELVPLPFVHMEAPIYLKGRARRGPTFREAVLMHAVARLALHPLIPNIQTSWVKMGPDGVAHCLQAGANDLGGTLMDETITRSAGAIHGQEMTPAAMEAIIRTLGRTPRQRTTTYATAPAERYQASFQPRHVPGHAAPPVAELARLRTTIG
ncbi:MAG: 7,8-didemethyl-8-hydroxy-5-deazariboflavin synthase subunit CofH [Rhizobiales bacterium]|nr:7,8-didemethyl-8-hydroxy-5-deazariboflavin synthase subunit CofH [Hyphomicrobiales bacterium]